MIQRPALRGGRIRNYHVTPLRYGLSPGAKYTTGWDARAAGFLYVAFGAALMAAVLLPFLGSLFTILLAAFVPVWMIIDLVTIVPSNAEPMMYLALGALFWVVGAEMLQERRLAFGVGMIVAIVLFLPAFWPGTLAGTFLLLALWRGQKALAEATPDTEGAPQTGPA